MCRDFTVLKEALLTFPFHFIGFTEEKSAPRIGWDGIIAQIVDSACDGK